MEWLNILWAILTYEVSGYPLNYSFAWIPWAVMGAASVLKGLGQQSQQRTQNKLADALQAYQSGKASEGRAAIERYSTTLTPDARLAERTAIQDELRGNFGTAADSSAGYESARDFGGIAPERFARSRAEGRGRTDERVKRAIEQLSIMSAPAQRDLRQAVRYGTAATDVDAANTASNELARKYAAAIQNTRVPGYGAGGADLLGGLGLGLFASGK